MNTPLAPQPGPAAQPGSVSSAFPAAAEARKEDRFVAGRSEGLLVALSMAVVVWFFHWTVKANGGFESWQDLDYFQLLVKGWKKGQLHLDKAPAPELLALADPYDPAQNGPYKLGDASLYQGKYYIYFGPTPAATLMLPYSLLTGRDMTMGYATFVFATVAFLAASGLWLAVRQRYFGASRALVAPLGVLAIGFGTHLLALAQRPMIWELPISSAIAFTLLGAVAVYRAIHGLHPLWAMAAAGLCLGLGVGARPTCLLACTMLAVPPWLAWSKGYRGWWKLCVAAAVPLALCGVALAWHNYARFGNPLEWGQKYQLSGAYEGKLLHFSPRFLAHNFSVYFFQALGWSAEFPYALARAVEINHIRDYFGTEEVAGLLVTFPIFWFLLGLPLAWQGRSSEERRRFTATMGCIAGYLVPVGALVMCYFSTTTRYQADFAVVAGVVALVGMLGVERWAQRLGGWSVFATLATGAVMVTVVIGVMMSFDYHGRQLRVTSPKTWSALEQRGTSALTAVGLRLGVVEGPQVLKVRFKQQVEGTEELFWRSQDPRAAEKIHVKHVGERLIRFGYARGDEAIRWGRDLKWDIGHTHTVSVQLPSLYSAPGGGFWDSLRRPIQFRQRTSVAVWFSGGRALEAVVTPLPRAALPGGTVAAGFSGEIRQRTTRAYRDDEIATGLTDYWAKRGGVLRMKIVFPEELQESGEPIFTTGAHYRSSIVFVEPHEGGLRFSFENYTFPRVHTPVFQPRPEGHVLELEMASFNPEAFGHEATGDVVIRLDGRELMRSRQVAYPSPWGQETIGTNPFGTTCALSFRGWIYDAVWVLPAGR